MATDKEVTLKLLTKVNDAMARMEGKKLGSVFGKAIEKETVKALNGAADVFAAKLEKVLKKSLNSLGAAQRLKGMQSEAQLSANLDEVSSGLSYVDPMVSSYITHRKPPQRGRSGRFESPRASTIADRMFNQASGVYGSGYKGASAEEQAGGGGGKLAGSLGLMRALGLGKFATAAVVAAPFLWGAGYAKSGIKSYNESLPDYTSLMKMGALGDMSDLNTFKKDGLYHQAASNIQARGAPNLLRKEESIALAQAITRGAGTYSQGGNAFDMLSLFSKAKDVGIQKLAQVPGIIGGAYGGRDTTLESYKILTNMLASRLEKGKWTEMFDQTAKATRSLADTSPGGNLSQASRMMGILAREEEGYGTGLMTPTRSASFIQGVDQMVKGGGNPTMRRLYLMNLANKFGGGTEGYLRAAAASSTYGAQGLPTTDQYLEGNPALFKMVRDMNTIGGTEADKLKFREESYRRNPELRFQYGQYKSLEGMGTFSPTLEAIKTAIGIERNIPGRGLRKLIRGGMFPNQNADMVSAAFSKYYEAMNAPPGEDRAQLWKGVEDFAKKMDKTAYVQQEQASIGTDIAQNLVASGFRPLTEAIDNLTKMFGEYVTGPYVPAMPMEP